MMLLLLVVVFFLLVFICFCVNWCLYLCLVCSLFYFEWFKYFVGVLIKFVIWIVFFELVLCVWGYMLVEVVYSFVNGKWIVDVMVGLISIVFVIWFVWILFDMVILWVLLLVFVWV